MAVEALAPGGRTDRGWVARAPSIVFGLLLVLFVVLGLDHARRDAPAVDEVVDLTAGLVALEHRDLRMNPEHGLVPHVGSAILPVLLADPVVPRTAAYEEGDWFDHTADVIEANRRDGRLDDVVFWYRVAPILVGAGTAVLVKRLAGHLFGVWAGFVAGGLWLTSPYVLGVAHLGTLDVWYAASLVLIALAARRVWTSPSPGSVLVLGCSVGLAALVRHQGMGLVIPAFVLVALRFRGDHRRLTAPAMVLVLPILVVWVAYRGVDPTPVDGAPGERFEQLIESAAAAGPAERLAMAAPLPEEWRAGAGYLVLTSEPRPAYVVGSHWVGGRPWYLVVNALVKLPLSTTVLVLAGAVAFLRRRVDRRAAAVSLAVAFGLDAVLLHVQPLNLGLRLALPLLAMACVVAGAAVHAASGRIRLVLLSVLGVVQLASFVSAHPTSLAWTPPPFTDGYRFLSDSSIDLGQGTDALRERHRRHPLTAVSVLQPRGVANVGGLPRIEDVDPSRLTGEVAVGATELTVFAHEELSWLRAYCPVEVVEGSILVYRFERPPDVSPGPTMPRPPCDRPWSTR